MKQFVDLMIDWETNLLLIEIDENQHSTHDQTSEIQKMIDIAWTSGGIIFQWFFLRFNPNKFKLCNDASGKVTTKKRQAHLLEWVFLWKATIPKVLLQVIYLYYDGKQNQTRTCGFT